MEKKSASSRSIRRRVSRHWLHSSARATRIGTALCVSGIADDRDHTRGRARPIQETQRSTDEPGAPGGDMVESDEALELPDAGGQDDVVDGQVGGRAGVDAERVDAKA